MTDDHLRRTSARGGLILAISQGAQFLIRLTSQIVVARLLVPADYGLVAMVTPIIALVALFGNLGLTQAIIQQRDISHEELNTLFWIGVAANILAALVTAALTPLAAWFYREPRVILIALMLALLLPISAMSSVHSAILNREMRFSRMAIVDLLTAGLALIVGVVSALNHLSYWSLVLMTATEAVMKVLLVWLLTQWRPSRPRIARGATAAVLVGAHVTGYNLAGYLTTSADNLLLGAFRGESELGLYDRGYKIVTQPMTQLAAPFSRLALPLLMRLRNDEPRYRNVFRRMNQMMLLLALPAILATMIFARPLVILLLGDQWAKAAPVIAWLSLGATGSTLYSSTYWIFLSQGRSRDQLTFVFLTSAISIAGFVTGLKWGATGVAAGASLSFLLLSVPLTFWGATRIGPVSTRDAVAPLVPLFVSAIVTSFILTNINRLFLPNDSLALFFFVYFLSYIVFSMSLCLSRAGRQILRELWQARDWIRGGS